MTLLLLIESPLPLPPKLKLPVLVNLEPPLPLQSELQVILEFPPPQPLDVILQQPALQLATHITAARVVLAVTLMPAALLLPPLRPGPPKFDPSVAMPVIQPRMMKSLPSPN